MKPGDDVKVFYWNAEQYGKVVGVFGNNVLVRIFNRNGVPSVIKILAPASRVMGVGHGSS